LVLFEYVDNCSVGIATRFLFFELRVVIVDVGALLRFLPYLLDDVVGSLSLSSVKDSSSSVAGAKSSPCF